MKIHKLNFFNIFFGELINRIMCWSHMGRKCDDRLARISDKEIRANIRTDIYSLQLARKKIYLGRKKNYLGGKKFLFGVKSVFIWG